MRVGEEPKERTGQGRRQEGRSAEEAESKEAAGIVNGGAMAIDTSVEIFVLITSVIVGLSHIVRADDWTTLFQRLHSNGRPAAFANGALSLVTGSAIVATHVTTIWPKLGLAVIGWLMVGKGVVCFLAPDHGLRSMQRASRRGFVVAGFLLVGFGLLAGYCAFGPRLRII